MGSVSDSEPKELWQIVRNILRHIDAWSLSHGIIVQAQLHSSARPHATCHHLSPQPFGVGQHPEWMISIFHSLQNISIVIVQGTLLVTCTWVMSTMRTSTSRHKRCMRYLGRGYTYFLRLLQAVKCCRPRYPLTSGSS